MKDTVGSKALKKTKGALLTWMLRENFANTAELAEGEEPTALTEVVRRLRLSAELQEAWKDIRLHAQQCLQLTGGTDVSVCLEVCPEAGENRLFGCTCTPS